MNNLEHYFSKFSNVYKFINVRKHNHAKLKMDIFGEEICFIKDYDSMIRDDFYINNIDFEFMRCADNSVNCYVQQHLIYDNIEIELFSKLNIKNKEIKKENECYDLYYNGDFYKIDNKTGFLQDNFPIKTLPKSIFDWKEDDIFYFNLKKV